jgi:DegV family protein with EDD domain
LSGLKQDFNSACITGFERLSAFADLLDEINVFPVADGDTGTNLKLSLAGLRRLDGAETENVIRDLLFSARGNSGNIAARFFSGFLTADSFENLEPAAREGRDLAWKAVNDPQPGTMLSVFDALVDTLGEGQGKDASNLVEETLVCLKNTVKSTPRLLPRLKEAGVVDSGALGMFIYFEAFFHALIGKPGEYGNVFEYFEDGLEISPTFQEKNSGGYCIDMVLKADEGPGETIENLSEIGDELVLIHEKGFLKVHLHTHDREEVRKRSQRLGQVVHWADDDLAAQVEAFRHQVAEPAIHVMTDGAGTVTRQDARALGITLLDGYVNAGADSRPESSYDPAELYALMRNGIKVSTSQPSVVERRQCYRRVVEQHRRTLYLCVNPLITDNYSVAARWKEENDPENRLVLMDTTAVTGRLGLLAMATARRAMNDRDPETVIAFARNTVSVCQEYIFLDTLKYMAAGGRLPKAASGGNGRKGKPVLSQTPKGFEPAGSAQDLQGQVAFALGKLGEFKATHPHSLVLIEYSDNRPWVEGVVAREVAETVPMSEIICRPLPITAGIHLGPGAWAIGLSPNGEDNMGI